MQIHFSKELKVLFVPLIFSILLVLLRISVTQSLTYGFLLWNMFLAFIPYPFAYYSRYSALRSNHFNAIVSFGIALLFLPNAPYILTDFLHLEWHEGAPVWFDTMMLFSASMSGLLFFYNSLFHLEKLWPSKFRTISSLMVIILCGFGIYLGRYLRFNSWDVLFDPFSLSDAILTRVSSPFEYLDTWSFTIAYAIFLSVGYVCLQLHQKVILQKE